MRVKGLYMGFDANKFKGDFLKDNYDRLNLTVPSGDREKIKAVAEEKNYKSLNDFCIEAIYEKAGLPKPEQKQRGRKPKPKATDKEKSD